MSDQLKSWSVILHFKKNVIQRVELWPRSAGWKNTDLFWEKNTVPTKKTEKDGL
jgi:hypothetical protein